MDQFTKEGRKLRPRKSAAGSAATSERVEYHPSERKSYGESRGSYGEHRSGSYRGNSGEHRGNSGERRSYGEHRGYGERRNNYTEGRSEGSSERRSYSSGSREHRSNFSGSYGSEGGRGGYGQRKSYNGGEKSYGGRNYGDKSYSSGRSYGKKPYGKGRQNYNKSSEEGINRMISRRPVVNGSEEVVENVPNMIKDEIRLNKFIANSGVCSRREADTLIQAGVVTVNGEVVTELGTKVNIYEDDIRFNGERLKGEEKVYIVMNKPKGFVTTASDPHAEKTVLDLMKACKSRVYPVGRLDKNTTGVLMLTNDGEIAERLTHPSYDKKKIYQVSLDRALDQEDYEKILSGVVLSDGEVKADELEYIDETDRRKLGIEIHSGKNRIVRRIFESLGYTVKALDRVYFAGLTKKGLKKGEWRYLTESEANILKMGAYI